MDPWSVVHFASSGLPLLFAGLLGHFYFAHHRSAQRKALAVLASVRQPNQPLTPGPRAISGVVRARRKDQPPIEGVIRYREQRSIGDWSERSRKLRARSFDVQVEDLDEVVKVELGRGSKWTLEADAVHDKRRAQDSFALHDGERVLVQGELQRRAKEDDDDTAYRGGKPKGWTLREGSEPILIRSESAARAHTQTPFWPLPLVVVAVCCTLAAVANAAVLVLTERTAEEHPAIAYVYETEEKPDKGANAYKVRRADFSFTSPEGRRAHCADVDARAGLSNGSHVQVRVSPLMPDACYEVGHYRVSQGRLVFGLALALVLFTLVMIALSKRKAPFFMSKPWFERP